MFPIYKTEESKDCYVDVDVLFRRRRKTEKNGKEKGGKYSERDITFFWRRKAEREKEENIWKWSLQNLSRIFRSLSFGLETFANFWRVLELVSENLVSRKKSLGFGFGEFGLGKKYWFRFQKIWSLKRVSVSVSENMVSEKKFRCRFRSKFCYRHSVLSTEAFYWNGRITSRAVGSSNLEPACALRIIVAHCSDRHRLTAILEPFAVSLHSCVSGVSNLDLVPLKEIFVFSCNNRSAQNLVTHPPSLTVQGDILRLNRGARQTGQPNNWSDHFDQFVCWSGPLLRAITADSFTRWSAVLVIGIWASDGMTSL